MADMIGIVRAPGTDPEPLRGQGPEAEIAAGDTERERERERLQHPMTSLQPLPTRKKSQFFLCGKTYRRLRPVDPEFGKAHMQPLYKRQRQRPSTCHEDTQGEQTCTSTHC